MRGHGVNGSYGEDFQADKSVFTEFSCAYRTRVRNVLCHGRKKGTLLTEAARKNHETSWHDGSYPAPADFFAASSL